MKMEIVKDPIFKTSCNFCDNHIKESSPVYGIIRDRGNSSYVRICDDCLKELIDFRQKHFEKIF